MTLLQRRRRAVYRVYSEDEYLAGVDPFIDWEVAPAGEPKHGPSLQRVAGVVALTGAVGTVGVTVGLVGLRSHPSDRQIAVAAVSSPAHTVPSHRAPARGESTRVAPRAQGGLRAGAAVVGKALSARATEASPATPEQQPEQATYTPVASTPQEASAPVAGTAQSTPTETAPAPRAQSEFGFER